jgi:hypothetical protein
VYGQVNLGLEAGPDDTYVVAPIETGAHNCSRSNEDGGGPGFVLFDRALAEILTLSQLGDFLRYLD